MTKYRLVRDIYCPDLSAKKGDIGEYGDDGLIYFANKRYSYNRETVKGNPQFFEEIPDTPSNKQEPKEGFKWTDELVKDHVIEFVKWTEGKQFFFTRQWGRWYRVYNEFLKEKGKEPFPYFKPPNPPDINEYGDIKQSKSSSIESKGVFGAMNDLCSHSMYPKYTQEQYDKAIELAFESGRLLNRKWTPLYDAYAYPTFQDYLTHLSKIKK
jgi:hypothetical protein